MKIKYLAFLIALTFIIQGCGNAEPDEDNRISTVVAATLSAVPQVPTTTSTFTPTVIETFTPMPTPTWTPTSTPIPTILHVVYGRAGEIFIWTEGESPKKLTNTGIDKRPRISGDGEKVVFERNNELFVIDSDGSNLRVLV